MAEGSRSKLAAFLGLAVIGASVWAMFVALESMVFAGLYGVVALLIFSKRQLFLSYCSRSGEKLNRSVVVLGK
jgi:hypothetical protein